MSMSDPSSIERKSAGRLFVLRAVWAGIFTSILIFTLLSVLVLAPNETAAPPVFRAFLAFSVLLVALSFLMKQKFAARALETRDEMQSAVRFQTACIIAWALCEAAGLFGIMSRVITGSPYFYLPFVIAGVGMLLHFPRREQLLAATFKNRF